MINILIGVYSRLCSGMETQINELVQSVRQNILDDWDNFEIPPRTDDGFIAKFIRARKYNLTAAFLSIQKYYQNIHNQLDSLKGLYSSEFAQLYNMESLRQLSHRQNGASIFYWEIGKWDTSIASFHDVTLAITFTLEEMFQNPQFQINGYHLVVDTSHFGFSHVRQMTYHNILFTVKSLLERFPLRVAGIHFVNYPRIFWALFQLITTLLPSKLKGRVHLHSGFKSLAKFFPSEYLPQSMEGVLEEDMAWRTEIISKLVGENICYDSYWKREE